MDDCANETLLVNSYPPPPTLHSICIPTVFHHHGVCPINFGYEVHLFLVGRGAKSSRCEHVNSVDWNTHVFLVVNAVVHCDQYGGNETSLGLKQYLRDKFNMPDQSWITRNHEFPCPRSVFANGKCCWAVLLRKLNKPMNRDCATKVPNMRLPFWTDESKGARPVAWGYKQPARFWKSLGKEAILRRWVSFVRLYPPFISFFISNWDWKRQLWIGAVGHNLTCRLAVLESSSDVEPNTQARRNIVASALRTV